MQRWSYYNKYLSLRNHVLTSMLYGPGVNPQQLPWTSVTWCKPSMITEPSTCEVLLDLVEHVEVISVGGGQRVAGWDGHEPQEHEGPNQYSWGEKTKKQLQVSTVYLTVVQFRMSNLNGTNGRSLLKKKEKKKSLDMFGCPNCTKQCSTFVK